jgi:hypothetical protein
MKRPDELNSWEFIKEHLFDRVKAEEFSDDQITEFIRLYRQDRESRPKTGEALLIAFREELEKRFGYGDRFGDGCIKFLIGMIEKDWVKYSDRQTFLEQICAAEQMK